MDQKRRIAIYGGTFDPVHLGHIEIALRVSQLFGIDEFLFVPARVPPHKADREVSSGFHRYAMLALATAQHPTLCVSTFELERPERQYTVDTLDHFRRRHGATAELFFVMGADSWAEITTWREWQRLMTIANLIVATRPGFDVQTPEEVQANAARVIDVRGLREEEIGRAMTATESKVFITDAVMRDVSATTAREAARDEVNLKKLVSPEVADYIRKYGLYRNSNEAKLNC